MNKVNKEQIKNEISYGIEINNICFNYNLKNKNKKKKKIINNKTEYSCENIIIHLK